MEHRRRQNIVGIRVGQLRRKAGLTQKAFIARCQVLGWMISRETLAKIESGVRRVHDAEVALLARVLRVDADTLLQARRETLLTMVRHSPDDAGE